MQNLLYIIKYLATIIRYTVIIEFTSEIDLLIVALRQNLFIGMNFLSLTIEELIFMKKTHPFTGNKTTLKKKKRKEK